MGNAMSGASPSAVASQGAQRVVANCSRVGLALALALLAATFFLISPPPGKTYPGAIPWGEYSILRRLTELMSLHGLLVSVRGVEAKDLAYHLAAAGGLLLMGVRTLLVPVVGGRRRLGPAACAQVLLAGWVLLSLLSGLWAGDADLARGQALLYALGLGWAVAVGATLNRRHLPALLYGLLTICSVGAALCVWYYRERNPFHRPGFPVGNPLTLAAAILPGVLVALGILGRAVATWVHERRLRPDWPVAGALAALVPLIWCLSLTQGRGALLALGVGLATMLIFLVARWLRWALAGLTVVTVTVLGIWWFSVSHLDVAMARGATVRFRLYAWRYAAELWSASPLTQIVGHGAGSYPRLAGAFAARDRALDPAAFMGELVEHAHNELFEVLTEIGLVGGVTYVGGLLATLVAAVSLLRAHRSGPQRWLLLALVGSVTALLADAMTGVSLRLPGVGPVFYTLLGALWGAADASSESLSRGVHTGRAGARGSMLAALVCFAAAGGAGWSAVRNWSGVTREQAATVAFGQGRYQDARPGIVEAESRLLDPVRVLAARKLALESRYGLAREAFRTWLSQPTTAPSGDAWSTAVSQTEQAHSEALRLRASVPSLAQTDAIAARCAEWLSQLYASSQPRLAQEWAELAGQSWLQQRERTPYDVETLLALTHYRASLEAHVALLRDALRFLDTLRYDDPQRLWFVWTNSLAQLSEVPGFEETLGRFAAAAGPITPETNLDAIIASMAPETHRLLAAWHGLRGEYAAAAERAERAARLYHPMRPRFPTLESVALAEQADYTLRGGLDDAPQAAAMLRQVIEALPVIQAQKYAEMARPFRFRLTFCLLAAGQLDEALETLQAALGQARHDRPAVEQALHELVYDAAAAAMPDEHLRRVESELCPQFPAFCEAREKQE
jgi:O-antigen ligase/tetratricopeptide (TPR) repeat protein